MKVKALIIAAALLASTSVAFAQETNKDANGNRQYGPYETNRFFDNWFISVAGGVNASIDGILNSDNKTAFKPALGIDVNLGKWFDPNFGIRAGWNGLKTGVNNCNKDLKYNYIHGDLLWNVSNQWAGYKEKRFWDFIPYLSAGMLVTDAGKGFGAGAGLLNKLRLSNVVAITLDVRAIASEADEVYSNGGAILNTSALLGLQFNLGRNNWTRKSTTVAGYEAAVAAAEAASAAALAAKAKALKEAEGLAAENEALKAENEALRKQLADAKNVKPSNILDTPAYVYFVIGKSKLSTLEQAHLASIADQILACDESTKFTVAGNADSKTGSAKRNMQLSQQRADYVADALVNQYGVNAERLSVVANGGNDLFEKPELNRATIIEKD